MSLQSLLKKLTKFFSAENLQTLIINSFREIMIIIGSIGLFIIILIMFILAGKCNKATYNNDSNNNQTENKIITDNNIDNDKKKSYNPQEQIISTEDFMLPEIKLMDLSNDYIDFLPNKKFQLPDKSLLVKDYNTIIDDSIEDSLKYNFEKRKYSPENKK